MEEKVLVIIIVVSAVFALAGLGYIYAFSPLLGNDFYLNPFDNDGGIQFSPNYGCEKICEDGIFMGCEGSFDNFVCGVTCAGRSEDVILIGKSPCQKVDCFCNE